MSESQPPPPPPPPPPEDPDLGQPHADAPQSLQVEGILDGRVLDEATLRQAVNELGLCGAGSFRVDISGGRFTVLPVDTQVSAAAFDAAAQTNFLDRLQAVADAAQPSSIETNLRCKLIYADDVAETLFIVRGHNIEPVTRRRPKAAQDVPLLPGAGVKAPGGLSRRELLWLAPVLLIAGLIFAWQSGWMQRVMAARAEAVTTDSGPFGDMLTVELKRSWGNYYATLTRGDGYPDTPDALVARRDASEDLTTRAACELVGNGGELFVQLRQEDGKLLFETRSELRLLLTDTDGSVEVKLPGHMSADHLTLALSSGK